MRSAESAGAVSIFDGPLGAVAAVTVGTVDESARDRATAARRTRMGTPSGKIQSQEMDSGTPGRARSGGRRRVGMEEVRAYTDSARWRRPLAWNPWIRTALAALAGRLRTRVKNSPRSLGGELQRVLVEAAHSSWFVGAAAEGVKSLLSSVPAELT